MKKGEEGIEMAEVCQLWNQAADQGHVIAQRSLAQLHLEEGEKSQALKYFLKAAERGDAASQCALGIMFREGEGTRRNYAKAAAWFRRAAKQGLAAAQLALAQSLEHGKGVPKSESRALYYLCKASKQNLPEAQAELAGLLLRSASRDGQQNDALAEGLLAKAASAGHEVAGQLLGEMRSYKSLMATPDAQESTAVEFPNNAQEPNIQPSFQSAQQHQQAAQGGGPGNVSTAEQLYDDAMERYNVVFDSLNSRSTTVSWAVLGERDEEEMRGVLARLQEAAMHGYVVAQYTIGVLHHDGQGVRRNDQEAAMWWHMAAEGGDAEAMLALACLHEKGHGVTQSSVEAANWRRRAAQV